MTMANMNSANKNSGQADRIGLLAVMVLASELLVSPDE